MRIESLLEIHGQFPDIDGFWDFLDLQKSEANIRELLPADQGSWTAKSIEVLTQLARVEGLQGKLIEAQKTLEQVQKLMIEVEETARRRLEIRYNLEQGRRLCLSMTPAKAQAHFAKAWDLSAQIGDVYFLIDAALMISISQPPKFKNEWLQKALELAEETDIEQGQLWLAQLYTMEGWHLFDFRKYAEALESFKKALSRPRFRGDETKVLVIRWCIARVIRALNRPQEALDIQRELMAELMQAGKANGHVFLEIGECLQVLHQSEEAKTYFEMAYKELSATGWYSDNKLMELKRMQHLSKNIFKKKKPPEDA